jgi:hypothetical protein
LGLEWPVYHYGNKRSGAQFPIRKHDLLEIHRGHWGALSPPYKHAGSGYWRARFVHAADALSVMVADPAEVEGLSSVEWYSADVVEGLDARALESLAIKQRDALFFKMQPKEFVAREFHDAVCFLALTYGTGKRPRYSEPPRPNQTLF